MRAVVALSRLLLASSSTTVWCSVPNYRYYRFTPLKARGFRPSAASHCGSPTARPDGCTCSSPGECRSGYCLPGATATVCSYPIVQVSEVEFWRAGRPVQLGQRVAGAYDAYRVANAVDVPMAWGIWELELYGDTNCSRPLAGGRPISSSERPRGFGHVNPQALQAPGGAAAAWQSSHEEVEGLERHGPAALAFDGDLRSNWWAACGRPCRARSEWLGREYAAPPGPLRCLRLAQAADEGYAAERLAIEGRRAGAWEALAELGALEAEPGAPPWRHLLLPQGAGFPESRGHGRAADGDLNSSVAETAGTALVFDLGAATEVDAWRWATAEEPLELASGLEDPRACAHDGHCPRDPVRWRLEGSSDGLEWVTLQSQDEDFPVAVHRRHFVPLQPVLHRVALGPADVWPDGRSRCAARR